MGELNIWDQKKHIHHSVWVTHGNSAINVKIGEKKTKITAPYSWAIMLSRAGSQKNLTIFSAQISLPIQILLWQKKFAHSKSSSLKKIQRKFFIGPNFIFSTRKKCYQISFDSKLFDTKQFCPKNVSGTNFFGSYIKNQNLSFRVYVSNSRYYNLNQVFHEFGFEYLEPGIQNLGFRIWDLGFRIWDLESFSPTDPFYQLGASSPRF